MNSKKCCYTVFSKDSKNKIEFKLELSDGIIPFNLNPLFLGVTFDERLSFNLHFNNLRNRAFKRLNIIKILCHKSWHLRSVLVGIYNALIGSIFAYSSLQLLISQRLTYIKFKLFKIRLLGLFLNQTGIAQTTSFLGLVGSYRSKIV